MAQRDLNFSPDVTHVTPTNPDDLLLAVASMGNSIADASAQSKLLAASAKAHVGFKELDTQYRQQYASDPTNADGLKELAQKRSDLADQLGEGIPTVYNMDWKKKTTELATASDVSNEVWGATQQRTNTVNNVNDSIRTYLDAGNKDGQAFGASNSADASAAMGYLTARANLEQFGSPIIGAPKTGELLKDFNKDYVKSFVAGVAETSPLKASELLNSPEIKEHFTTQERGDMIDVIARTKRQQQVAKDLTVTVNNNGLTSIVNNPDTSYYEKRAEIDKLDMQGAITPSAAAKARRVIKSSSDLDTQTDTPVMADIVNQIYDLNATSQSNATEYLRGVRNVQESILEKQANGQLTAPDAGKLNKELTTLTSKRLSDATQQAGNEFYDANQKFNTLPPEYRGQATRGLFYAADGKNFTKQQYAAQANIIIDGINQKRRKAALDTASAAAKSDSALMREIKASPEDITATAQKYHISEAEVIRQIRNKRRSPAPVTRATGDETIAQPVNLIPMASPIPADTTGDAEGAADEGSDTGEP